MITRFGTVIHPVESRLKMAAEMEIAALAISNRSPKKRAAAIMAAHKMYINAEVADDPKVKAVVALILHS